MERMKKIEFYDDDYPCQLNLSLSGRTSKHIEEMLEEILAEIKQDKIVIQGCYLCGDKTKQVCRPAWKS